MVVEVTHVAYSDETHPMEGRERLLRIAKWKTADALRITFALRMVVSESLLVGC